MCISNQTLCTLANTHATPLYVYSREVIEARYAELEKALSSAKPLICFAIKANGTLEILRSFARLGAGFDIVSQGELRRALKAEANPEKIVFSGVGKDREELEFALRSGIKFLNVESLPELELLEAVARAINCKAPFCFRINPDVDASTHKHLTTGTKANKFGVPVADALEAALRSAKSPHLEFLGLDCHIGSQINEVEPLERTYVEMLRIANLFEGRGLAVRCIDLGGGFGIGYSGHCTPLDLGALAAMVKRVLAGKKYEFVFEPGRFLIAEAGTLLTRVLYLKENGSKTFAVVDAGMNDLVRPAMYDAFHAVELVSREAGKEPAQPTDVVGPVCESACYFAHNRVLPVLRSGDLLAIRDAGAYGSVMASNYNARRMPAEVLVEHDGSARVIRRRDTFEDLWKNEL
jgi:diaminopimelate decarboxylase